MHAIILLLDHCTYPSPETIRGELNSSVWTFYINKSHFKNPCSLQPCVHFCHGTRPYIYKKSNFKKIIFLTAHVKEARKVVLIKIENKSSKNKILLHEELH